MNPSVKYTYFVYSFVKKGARELQTALDAQLPPPSSPILIEASLSYTETRIIIKGAKFRPADLVKPAGAVHAYSKEITALSHPCYIPHA